MDSSGTLKTTISLGKNPSIVHSGPFYLMKEPPTDSESITGATNLMGYYGLEHSYSKFSGKKMKEQLSSFLPNLPMVMNQGNNVSAVTFFIMSCFSFVWIEPEVDFQLFSLQDNSSLRSVIEKPPILGKELLPLSTFQLAGFRLHPGPVRTLFRKILCTYTFMNDFFFVPQLPESYLNLNAPTRKHKNKHKKHKHKDGLIPPEQVKFTISSTFY
jgi:mediator of RNA polymerase II transcription subunit 19